MASGVLALVLIGVLFLGSAIGWHGRRAYGSHGDMKVNKSRVPTFRRNRNRAGLLTIALVILGVLLIKALTLH